MTSTRSVPAALAQKHGKPLITGATLRRIYTTLTECRMLADAAGVRPERQVAALAAVDAILAGKDIAAPEEADRISLYALGQPLEGTGSKPMPGIIPCSPEMATGAAAVLKRRNPGSVVVSFMRGRRPDLDVLRHASIHALPIVYLRINKNAGQLPELAFPAIPVDVDDAVAIYRVAYESIARARQGGGPTLIECWPYPLGAEDALAKMERFLASKGLIEGDWKQRVGPRFAEKMTKMRPQQ